ncbi:MAG: hypothetical protein ACYDBH_02670 [Acidobacteriaceae bacterium]
MALTDTTQTLSRTFDFAERQACQYVEEAAHFESPVVVTEATIPITFKLPPDAVR